MKSACYVKSLLAGVCCLTLGCSNIDASGGEDNVLHQSKADELGLKCQMIKPTGSHMKKKYCTTLAQRESSAAEGQKFIHSIKSGMEKTN